jgi:hypothetical protein
VADEITRGRRHQTAERRPTTRELAMPENVGDQPFELILVELKGDAAPAD